MNLFEDIGKNYMVVSIYAFCVICFLFMCFDTIRIRLGRDSTGTNFHNSALVEFFWLLCPILIFFSLLWLSFVLKS
ncbi:MAG: hypothetical protein VX335_03720 [Pseudomonadota bacterium]|nr:hypothetical protein [Pseudomonadota bacterium]